MTRMLRYTTSWFCAFMVVFAAAVLVFSAQTRSPSLFAANAVREALKEQGIVPDMRIIPRTSGEMRRVVSRNIDSRLLSQTQSICGRDFQYQLSEPSRTAHLGVIVLRYPTDVVAKRMAALLARRRNYFRNSIIFIRFSAIPLGSLLIVTYSENSGDDRIVEALNNLPGSFEKASGAGGVDWDESESFKTSQ